MQKRQRVDELNGLVLKPKTAERIKAYDFHDFSILIANQMSDQWERMLGEKLNEILIGRGYHPDILCSAYDRKIEDLTPLYAVMTTLSSIANLEMISKNSTYATINRKRKVDGITSTAMNICAQIQVQEQRRRKLEGILDSSPELSRDFISRIKHVTNNLSQAQQAEVNMMASGLLDQIKTDVARLKYNDRDDVGNKKLEEFYFDVSASIRAYKDKCRQKQELILICKNALANDHKITQSIFTKFCNEHSERMAVTKALDYSQETKDILNADDFVSKHPQAKFLGEHLNSLQSEFEKTAANLRALQATGLANELKRLGSDPVQAVAFARRIIASANMLQLPDDCELLEIARKVIFSAKG